VLQTDFQRDVYCLLGLPFDAVRLEEVVRRVRQAARRRQPLFFSTPNVNFVIGGLADKRFQSSVIESDLSIADGMPLIWIARLLGIPIRERIAGSSLFDALRKGSSERLTVFFFGAPDGVAETACRRLNAAPSCLKCAGFNFPGFGSVEELSDDACIARINESKADFLVVSLGAKKGQEWILRNRARLAIPVISHLGAVAGFVAGVVGRAPGWMQRYGLEWLWRIKEEPQLWRRYVRDGIALMTLLATRVIPYAWYLRCHEARADEVAGAWARADEEPGSYVVRLSGAWTHQNISPLRQEFSVAAGAEKDVILEMSAVTFVDSAFVALVQLLSGHIARSSRRLRIVGCKHSVEKIIKFNCADYLIANDSMT
jgi:N-acetylglucosaminyldiphosphoundecaprenol N-acetyl-beta-D-mannosaminyltransferase